MGETSSVAAVFSLNETQVGRDINLHHEEHHHYPAEQPKEEIVPPDLYHLPKPTTALICRKTELAQLTEALKNPNKRLAIIVAAGGIGKSALTDEWLQQISAHKYYGKTRVFGWSFYSQGSHNTFTNSQPFFSAVLPFLGITEIPKDEIEKARLLARCLQQQPCLLVLDGIEPLQYSENLQAMNGELQDSVLKEFIACFRRTAGKSFVLLSSRQPLVELKRWQEEHYLSLDLKTLPHEDGAALLQALGVTGTLEERQAISQDLNGHALSLVLMGHLLVEHHDGDCRYAKELPPLTSAHGDSDAEKDSRHALRVLDYYYSLQDTASRCFLQLLGLFDRPMNAAEKAVLIANANHAEPLRYLTEKQWQAIEQRLEKCGLLLGKKGTFERLEWDTHPIIRAYFGGKFKINHPETFKQAHLVLFDYYKKLPEKEFPDTLEEMLPLYRAVAHGCMAGEYIKAGWDIYNRRILRDNEYYSIQKLFSFSYDLMALAAFFHFDWNKPISELTTPKQAWLLSQASYCLLRLGRLSEALEPRIICFNIHDYSMDMQNSYIDVMHLHTIYSHLGLLDKAFANLQRAKYYVQFSTGISAPIDINCDLGELNHRLGLLEESRKNFQEMENLGLQYHPFLPGNNGFLYCDLLLDTARYKADVETVKTRAEYSMGVNKDYVRSIFRDKLTLARVYVILGESTKAVNHFEQALQYMHKSKDVLFTPLFYLYRADFYLTQNQLNPALADLNSAWEIIERCGMKLYAVDYLLIHGRYSLATADVETALNHYEEAKQLIEETGYHLRDAELDLFAVLCCQRHGNLAGKNADFYLQKAKKRIEEIGQWGLMPRWDKVAKGEMA